MCGSIIITSFLWEKQQQQDSFDSFLMISSVFPRNFINIFGCCFSVFPSNLFLFAYFDFFREVFSLLLLLPAAVVVVLVNISFQLFMSCFSRVFFCSVAFYAFFLSPKAYSQGKHEKSIKIYSYINSIGRSSSSSSIGSSIHTQTYTKNTPRKSHGRVSER